MEIPGGEGGLSVPIQIREEERARDITLHGGRNKKGEVVKVKKGEIFLKYFPRKKKKCRKRVSAWAKRGEFSALLEHLIVPRNGFEREDCRRF